MCVWKLKLILSCTLFFSVLCYVVLYYTVISPCSAVGDVLDLCVLSEELVLDIEDYRRQRQVSNALHM